MRSFGLAMVVSFALVGNAYASDSSHALGGTLGFANDRLRILSLFSTEEAVAIMRLNREIENLKREVRTSKTTRIRSTTIRAEDADNIISLYERWLRRKLTLCKNPETDCNSTDDKKESKGRFARSDGIIA